MNVGSLGHKAVQYLTGGKSAVTAVIGNHPYPARDLLITLAILIFTAWALLKIVKSIPTK